MLKKIAVLFGGNSCEREISLKSGYAVIKCLREIGMNVHPIEVYNNHSLMNLIGKNFSKVFVALHGGDGENGVIQGVLEYFNLSYTGSGVLASSLSINKIKSKQIWASLGLPIVPYISIKKEEFLYNDKNIYLLISDLSFPLIVKPNREGSSIGIKKINSLSSLKRDIIFTFKYDSEILIEKFLIGKEYTVAILGDLVLPPVLISTERDFYDYHAKYFSNSTKYFCPSGLKIEEENNLKNLALSAYKAIDCSGCARVDIIKDENNNFYLLEINTSPGLTSKSLVPFAAKHAGISFEVLLKKILKLSK